MATLTPQTRNAPTLTNQSRNSVTLTAQARSLQESFLLLESGFYMLLESGFKIILEQSVAGEMTLTPQTKN